MTLGPPLANGRKSAGTRQGCRGRFVRASETGGPPLMGNDDVDAPRPGNEVRMDVVFPAASRWAPLSIDRFGVMSW